MSFHIIPGGCITSLLLEFSSPSLFPKPFLPGSSSGSGGLSLLRSSFGPLNKSHKLPDHGLPVHVLGPVDPGPEDHYPLTVDTMSRQFSQSAANILGKGGGFGYVELQDNGGGGLVHLLSSRTPGSHEFQYYLILWNADVLGNLDQVQLEPFSAYPSS